MADQRKWPEENDALLMLNQLSVLFTYKVPEKLQRYDKERLDLVVFDAVRFVDLKAVDLQSSPNDDSMVMVPKSSIREHVRKGAARLGVAEEDAGAICDLVCNNVLQSELARKYYRYREDGSISNQKTVFTVAESTYDEIGITPAFVMALAQVTDLLTCLGVDRLDFKTYRVKKAIIDKNVDMVVHGLAEIKNDMMLEFTWISSQRQRVRSSFSSLDLPALSEGLSFRQKRYMELSASTLEARAMLQEMRSAAEEERSLTPAELDEIARADGMLDSCIDGYGALVSRMGRLLEEIYEVSARQISYDVGDMRDFDEEVMSKLPGMTAEQMTGALDMLLLPVLLGSRLSTLFPLDAFSSVEPMRERPEEAGFVSTVLSEGLVDEDEDRGFEADAAAMKAYVSERTLANDGPLPLSKLIAEAPTDVAERICSRKMLYKLFTAPLSAGLPVCKTEGATIRIAAPPFRKTLRLEAAGRILEFTELTLTAETGERGTGNEG